MTKVVINRCYGGFAISEMVVKELGVVNCYAYSDFHNHAERTDKDLIAIIEKYGTEKCSGWCACLEIVEYDETMFNYTIEEYDGWEKIVFSPIVNLTKLIGMNREEIKKYFNTLNINYTE